MTCQPKDLDCFIIRMKEYRRGELGDQIPFSDLCLLIICVQNAYTFIRESLIFLLKNWQVVKQSLKEDKI